MATTPEQDCAEMLVNQYLPAGASRDEILRVLRIAYLHGYTDCLRADVVRLQSAPVVEFPLRGAA